MSNTAKGSRGAVSAKGNGPEQKKMPKRVLLSVLLGIEMDYWVEELGNFDENTVDFSEFSNNNVKKAVAKLKTYLLPNSEVPLKALRVSKKFQLLGMSGTRTVKGVKSEPKHEYIAELAFFDTKALRDVLKSIHAELSAKGNTRGRSRTAPGLDIDELLTLTADKFAKEAANTQEVMVGYKAQGALMAETRKQNAIAKAKAAKKAAKAAELEEIEEEVEEEEEVVVKTTPKAPKANKGGATAKKRAVIVEEEEEEEEEDDLLDVDAPDYEEEEEEVEEEEEEEVKPAPKARAGGKKPRI